MMPFHRNPRVVVPVLLAILVLSVFGQIVRHGFLPIDDPQYVSVNPAITRGLTADGLVFAFTEQVGANYHPLTTLSHMLDVEIFGLVPAYHHAEGVLLHLAASVTLFFLVLSLSCSPWVGGIVAALFAVHPLHVEPVAWAASRKDLLCAFFWFLSMLAWVGYAREGGRRRYVTSLSFALLSMMSKPMAVTLPLTLLMIDWWPLRRVALPRVLVEKVPFLIVSAVTSVLTVVMQKEAGAIQATDFSLPARLSNATVSYATYLVKSVWPSGLAVFYPHPSMIAATALPAWKVALSVLLLVALSVVAWRERLRRPHLLFGWSFLVVTLLPVIGIVQVGGQAMADRYSYVPLVGIFVALAVETRERLAGRGASWRRAGMVAAVMAVLVLSALSFRQAGFWRDAETLFRHALDVTGPNPTMHRTLGEELVRANRFVEARVEFAEAVRLRPEDPVAMNWLGYAMAFTGDEQGAEATFRRVLSFAPRFAAAWYNLGSLLERQGRLSAAIEAYGVALREQPNQPNGWFSMGVAKKAAGDREGAIEAFSRAVELDPGFEAAWYNLGILRNETGGTRKVPTESNARKENGTWRR